jgi:hypothetical protein
VIEVHRVLWNSVATAFATILIIGTSVAETPATNVPMRQQIQDIDQHIELLEKMREAQEITNKIKDLLEEEDPATLKQTLGDLQAFLANVKDNLRTTDILAAGLQGEYGDDTSGIGFLMRQLYGVAKYFQDYGEIYAVKNHAGPNAPSTFMSGYTEGMGKLFEALSGVDVALQLINSAVNEDELTGGQALSNLGGMLSSAEDAIGLLGIAVNPVITAMISVYATALVNAGWVADNVLAPAVETRTDHIDALTRVLEGTYLEQDGEPPVDDGQARLDALDDVLFDLRHARDQLAAANDTDYSAARQSCIRSINNKLQTAADGSTTKGFDVDGNGVFDDSDAMRLVDMTLSDRAQINRDTQELNRQRSNQEIRDSAVRSAEANVKFRQELLDESRARDKRAGAVSSDGTQRAVTELEKARAALEDAQTQRDKLPDTIEELEKTIEQTYRRYEKNYELATEYKDCIRTLLEGYAPKTLEEYDDSFVPDWIKNCTSFDLSRSALGVLNSLDLRTSMAPAAGSGFSFGTATAMNASFSPMMGAFQVATDSPLWCTYGDGQGRNMAPVGPGGGAVTGGGSPTDDMAGGTPTGDETPDSDGGNNPASGMGSPRFSVPGFNTGDDDPTKDDSADQETTDEPAVDEPSTGDSQQPPGSPGTVRITFKVTNQVLMTDGQVAQNPAGENRRVKLFAPETQNPDLPVAGNDRNDTGSGEDPMQCTTNDLGECSMQASFNPDLMSTPVEGGSNGGETPGFEVDIPVNEVQAANVTLDSGTALPEDLAQYVVSDWSIGGQTTYSLAFQSGTDFQTMLNGFALGRWQIDLCRDEQPAAPIGSFDYPAPDSELPRSSVSLGFAREIRHEN